MVDRPILFSAPMVRALLAGDKTQTRRALRPQPDPTLQSATISAAELQFRPAGLFGSETHSILRRLHRPGDRLWVRESWRTESDCYNDLSPSQMSGEETVLFNADAAWSTNKTVGRTRAAMHMPRWASRLTLIVGDVRVQRLQEISDADARAEGVENESADPPFYYVPGIHPHSITAVGVEEGGPGPLAVRCYAKLWDYINGAGSWDANPWVAAYSFDVIRANIDADAADGRT